MAGNQAFCLQRCTKMLQIYNLLFISKYILFSNGECSSIIGFAWQYKKILHLLVKLELNVSKKVLLGFKKSNE